MERPKLCRQGLVELHMKSLAGIVGELDWDSAQLVECTYVHLGVFTGGVRTSTEL
jgi:hypothetical protein